jgi:hypothetical protein
MGHEFVNWARLTSVCDDSSLNYLLPLFGPQSMLRYVIRARCGLSDIVQDIAELKAQVAEKASDQTAPDDKDGVVFAVGGGGASELCHQQQFVADGAQFVVVIARQLVAGRVEQFVGFLIHVRFPSR